MGMRIDSLRKKHPEEFFCSQIQSARGFLRTGSRLPLFDFQSLFSSIQGTSWYEDSLIFVSALNFKSFDLQAL